ncbi:uncharacterized protein BJ212DRAFT_740349 [Suillus subaureus]|uniref:Uncharacterized protein n=1 Tax=Suillus subaureus TaxID=48587 RepID=A0A9P7ART3_9AGAM|nr:uncharacterized protein BJ212DRAFT_740349 [Suillus subaureus]KAG1793774.1 hypothetical protein BJ212DRAFT_740349 [Suillus subaureus]
MIASDLVPNDSVYTLPWDEDIGTLIIPQVALSAVIRSAGISSYNHVNPVMRNTVTTSVTDVPSPMTEHGLNTPLVYLISLAPTPRVTPAIPGDIRSPLHPSVVDPQITQNDNSASTNLQTRLT